jgi:hypothetical protein
MALLVIIMGYWRSIFLNFLFCRRLFFDILPFSPIKKDKLLGDFHVIRRCPPNKYIYLIMRLTYGAPMPPAPLVITYASNKKKSTKLDLKKEHQIQSVCVRVA